MKASPVTNISFGVPFIEIETFGGSVDLHNFADFSRFEFTSAGTATLAWEEAEYDRFRLGSTPIRRLELEIPDVSKVVVTPRDPEIPASEDKTVEFIEANPTDHGRLTLRFVFSSGMEIIIDGGAPLVSAS